MGILMSISVVFLLMTGFGSTAARELSTGEVAIKGYDAVAYFKAGKALKDGDAFTCKWHNMIWHFLNKENRDLFAADPEKYTPQYDGWCAWAMTESRKAITNPEVWTIVEGKLYLQCSLSAYEKWSKDIPGNIKKADENWLNLNSLK
jgi:hypothetical protein